MVVAVMIIPHETSPKYRYSILAAYFHRSVPYNTKKLFCNVPLQVLIYLGNTHELDFVPALAIWAGRTHLALNSHRALNCPVHILLTPEVLSFWSVLLLQLFNPQFTLKQQSLPQAHISRCINKHYLLPSPFSQTTISFNSYSSTPTTTLLHTLDLLQTNTPLVIMKLTILVPALLTFSPSPP